MFGYTVLGSGIAALSTSQYSFRIETRWLQLERVTVPVKNLGSSFEGFKIALLGDFHLYPHTEIELIRRAVDMANDLKPDLVALLGDYVLDEADSIFELAPVLARLNAPYGVFSVLGNHDHWKGATIVRRGLEESGLPVLDNSGLTLSRGKDRIYLAGLGDGWMRRFDLSQALEKQPQDVPIILLIHEPDFADTFSADSRISLQLSGHSHGGQVRLPGIGAPVLPPYGRKYDQGLYRVQDMWLYTNRGIGVTVPPVRFNCRPEVTEMTLVSRPMNTMTFVASATASSSGSNDDAMSVTS